MTERNKQAASETSDKQAKLLKKLRKILYGIVGPTTGIGFTYAYFYFSENPIVPIGIAIGLGVGAVTHAGALSYMVDSSLEKISSEQRRILASIAKTKQDFIDERDAEIRSRMRLSRISPNSLNLELSKSISEADTVRNTFINLSPYYHDRDSENLRAATDYGDLLFSGREKNWIDITTYADLTGPRYRLLRQVLAERIEQGVPSGNLSIRVCDVNSEFLNFMIFERGDKPFEVYFGWIGREGARPDIFRSNEAELVLFFAQHFRNLERQAVEKLDNVNLGELTATSQAFHLIGTWISVPQISSARAASSYDFYSVVSISSDRSGWQVNADIYSKKAERVLRQVRSARVSFYGDHLSYTGDMESLKDKTFSNTSGTYMSHATERNRLHGKVIGRDGSTHNVSLARLSDIASGESEIDHTLAKKLIAQMISEWEAEE